MTLKFYICCCLGCMLCFGNAQTDTWMTSMPIAKKLALQQNKPILMVWEEATMYPLPVLVNDENGKKVVLRNMFEVPELTELLWEHFVLVVVEELFYEDMFADIKGKRRQSYIDSFNDDTLKVMDASGTIIGTSGAATELLNLSAFVEKYALNMSYLKQEQVNYNTNKDFYSTFYLATKYIDYSVFVNKKLRPEILKVSDIYLKDTETLLAQDTTQTDKAQLLQRIALTKLNQDLVKNKSRRVLRELKKFDASKIEGANASLFAFLNYTAHRLRNDTEEFAKWESQISLVNLKKAQAIININR